MAIENWCSFLPRAKLTNLMASIINHSPILLSTYEKVFFPSKHNFRFKNAWLLEDGLEEVMHKSWHMAGRNDLLLKLNGSAQDLNIWGRHIRSRFRTDILRCKNKLEELCYKQDEVYV